ncbi:MAG: leucine-rich repeat domain-containing protein, partial [Clostridia bacterium]|nr:leucine-rich repeat domain-containing protein [Clostridia bacterium]
GDYAFMRCTSLTSVVIPDSVTTIEHSAFSGCTGLVSFVMGDGVTKLSNGLLGGCTNLKSVTIGKGLTSVPLQLLHDCTNLESVTTPFLAKSFGGLFGPELSSDNSQYVPASVKSVTITGGSPAGNYFKDSIHLTSVTIEDGVTRTGSYTNCTGLTEFTIPGSVKTVGSNVFKNCVNLTTVNIRLGVEKLRVYAFSYSGVTTINFEGTVDEWNAIEKENGWDKDTQDYTVVCSDGVIPKATTP